MSLDRSGRGYTELLSLVFVNPSSPQEEIFFKQSSCLKQELHTGNYQPHPAEQPEKGFDGSTDSRESKGSGKRHKQAFVAGKKKKKRMKMCLQKGLKEEVLPLPPVP